MMISSFLPLGATDPEHIQMSNIHIDATTEAFDVIQMPIDKGQCQQAHSSAKLTLAYVSIS